MKIEINLIKILTFLLISIGLYACNLEQATEENKTNQQTEQKSVQQTPEAKQVKVTMQKYNQLKTGMTYQDVVKILNEPGQELSSNEMAGISTVMYQWEGESFASNMNALFQNNKMVSKAQFGLK